MSDQAGETPPLFHLQRALQEFVSATSDTPEMVSSGLVVWETVSYDDQGQPFFAIDYASIGVNESMTAAIGLVSYAKTKMLRDLIGGTEDEDEVG